MQKDDWLRTWGYTLGTPEAETAWEEKLNFRPKKAGFGIFSRMDVSYDCPVTGDHITSLHQHKENLKKHGCREYETGEKEYSAKQRAKADAEFDRKIEATVEKTIDNMPGEKREQLARELTSGVDVQVTRN